MVLRRLDRHLSTKARCHTHPDTKGPSQVRVLLVLLTTVLVVILYLAVTQASVQHVNQSSAT